MATDKPEFEKLSEVLRRLKLDEQEPDPRILSEGSYRRGFVAGAKAALYAYWNENAPSESNEAIEWLREVVAWAQSDRSEMLPPPMPFEKKRST